MTITSPVITIQVRAYDEVLEPFRPAVSAAYHHTSADYQRVSRCVMASA
jgi:hypothetical protein